jgi:amino acid adenylation domain-containing protein
MAGPRTPATGHEDSALLHTLFREAAARWPQALAVATPGRCLTYRELDDLSDRLAQRLRQLGSGPGSLVAVTMGKGWEQVVAVLGALKAGVAYLPVDPDLPTVRFHELLTRAGCRHLLAQPHPAKALPPLPKGVEVVEVGADLGTVPPARPRPAEPGSSDDLAYVLFTSGSTGQPKGVMIEHRGAVNTVRDLNERFDVGPGDRILGLSSLGFDMSVYDMFGALTSGAAVVLPEPAQVRDPAAWIALMRQFGVTVWNSVPALLAMLVAWLEDTGCEVPTGLRLAFLGGDWIPLDLPDRARAFFEDLRMVNIGGATEASICSCFFVVDRVDPAWASIPYGRALSNQYWEILDRDLRPCSQGVPGDLYIGGVGLARGYLNDPVRTAEAFIRHPETGRRLYRTGDRGRWLPDGNIEFLGRTDHQVKVRGHRVELGEIEAHAQQHQAVRQAVAVAVGPSTNLDRIVLFVTAPGDLTESQLRDFLAQRLPAYLIPDRCGMLETLPLTGNGKVDRAALRQLARALNESAGSSEPVGETERRLATLWQALLPDSLVGRDSDFFAIGGNSLIATQLAGRIRREFGADVSAAFAFQATTVAAMAHALDRPAAPAWAPEPAGCDVRAERPGLTFGQEQLWFFDQLGEAGRAYQFQASIRFSGRLDVGALRRALTQVVARHEVLRTTYTDTGGGPEPIVHPPYQVRLESADLRQVPIEHRERALRRAVDREIARPFDLARLPLIRWRLYRIADEDWTLTEVEHHIVHDGWSVALLWREVERLYRAWHAGHQDTLPGLDLQMRDYARLQRERFRRRAPKTMEYWRQALAGVSPLDLPTARRRPARQTFEGRSRRVTLDFELYRRLRAFGRAHGCSLYVVMLSAYAILLHRYTDDTDICVGSWVANRQDPEAEGLIGMLVNMIVMRNELSPESSVADTLRRVRGTAVAAFDHQDAPFHEVVRAVDPRREPGRNPLVQVCFSLHDSPVPEFSWPGVKGIFVEEHNGSAKFDLNVVVVPHAEQRRLAEARRGVDDLVVIWEYNTDLFEADDIDRMIGHYEQILRGMLADPGARIAELDLRTAAEKAQDAGRHATRTPIPDASLPELVFRQAERTPGAVAVQYEDDRLSYRELTALARSAAGALRAAGVARGDLVAISQDRSIDLVAHLLGIMAVGAAYVPLDPAHPVARNQLILESARPVATIASERYADRFDGVGGAVLTPVQLRDAPDATAVRCAAAPDDRAYVLFTSGSTGRPKGVEVAHRSVVNLLWDMRERLRLRGDDVLLALTTISFDISVLELFLPLLVGARVDIGSDRLSQRPAEVIERMGRVGATILQATPTMWRLLLASGGWRRRERFVALCGGEVFSADLADRMLALCTETWNLYGPTETTIWSTAHLLTPERGAAGSVPIGRPIANTRCLVLNPAGLPQPVGVRGELYIGGAGAAVGYLGMPELTADRFRTLRPVAGADDRVFATGDVVRRRADGDLEFLGRADTQVKIRGVRVELGEIEEVLRGCSQVRDAAAALTVERTSMDRQLVAYVELDGAGPAAAGPDLEQIQAYLRSRLPAAMVPHRLVPVERLPTTPNGKVDRGQLARLDSTALPTATTRQDPQPEHVGRTEQALAKIFAEVLGVALVGRRADFFELGGHSLLALRLAQRIREEFEVEVGLGTILDHGTVAELATAIDEARQ